MGIKTFFFILLVFLTTACSKQETASLSLPDNVPIVAWKTDNAHIMEVKGTVTLNGEGVEGAVIQIGSSHVRSDHTGHFIFTIDGSKISRKEATVVDTEDAKLNGKPLSKVGKTLLQKQKTSISVAYPVKIETIREEEDKVLVTAKAIAENDEFPTIQTGKYVIMGTVKDYKGNPVKGAVVSTTNDQGEGWAKSNPSDEKGNYMIALTPDNGEDSTFRVSVNNIQYTMPPNKVFRFPEESSDEIDITLPETGTIIDDKPPTLVAKQISGNMNEGIIIGLEEVNPKEYSVTVPSAQGEFILTLPKKIWEKHPQFMEKKINQFYEKVLTPHDLVPKEWLQ